MKTWILHLALLTSLTAMGQKLSITGIVKDSTGSVLQSATLLVLSPKDSSMVNFGISNAEGRFELKNLNRENYLLRITFVGYASQTITIVSTDELLIDIGTIRMTPESKLLDAVTIKAEKAPVVVKKDTIEFDATAFKPGKQNAVVEDLLKKLPGVEVDADGTVRAQGEQVRRVTVDGKNFFGSDPKLATRNLPADAVDKVQVFDKKSDQTAFTGIDDGQREKTINLELKEEKRNGIFGNVMAGAGGDERFQGKANVNRFKKGQQLSFLGMANNVNEQGFSIDDYLTFTGGAQQMMAGRGGAVRVEFNANNQNAVPLSFGGRTKGLMTTYAGGANVNNTFNKKTEVNASYFFNRLDHNLTEATERINYLPGGDLAYQQVSRQHNTNNNHRVNAVLDHKIDSLNSFKLTTTFSLNETESHDNSTSENMNPENFKENSGVRNTNYEGTTGNFNSSLLWRHRFSKKGRTVSGNLSFGIVESDLAGDQQSTSTFYGEVEETEDLMQESIQKTINWSYAINLSYTEPLGGRKYLEGNYSFRENLNHVDRRMYDVNSGEPVLNTALSNNYKSDYEYHRAGLNFRVNRTKYNLTIGSSLQQTTLDGELIMLDTGLSKSYTNLLPVLRFNYQFSGNENLRFDYETSVQEPTIQQLQPVVDNRDPLNVTVGNPNLQPAYVQNWRLHFTTFSPVNFMSFFGMLNAFYTTQAITTAQNYTENGVRVMTPVNVNNNFRVNANATFSFPVQKIKSRFGITATSSYDEGASVINDEISDILQNSIGGTLRYNFRYKELLDVNLNATVTRQSTDYEFAPDASQLFFNKTYTGEVDYSFLRNYSFQTTLEYLVYESKTNHYKQEIPLLNISLSRFILKAKSGEIKVSFINVLDKNIGISQQADINYFERSVSNSLSRYFMVSFIYSINKHLNPMSMRPRGGVMRVMH
jgi:hypothetical protein